MLSTILSGLAYGAGTIVAWGEEPSAEPPAQYPSVWAKPTEITHNVGPWRGDAAENKFEKVGESRVSVGPGGVFLSNGSGGVGLAPLEKGAGITSLYCFATRREAISEVSEKPVLWKLFARRPNGRSKTVSNKNCGLVPTIETMQIAQGDLRAILTWKGVKAPETTGDMDVKVTITLPKDSSIPHWHIAVANRMKGAVLARATFPMVEHLGFPGESDALVHSTYSMMTQGELHRRAQGLMNGLYGNDRETFMWPSGAFPIQHISVSIGSDTVVYVGWHDGQGYPKAYVYDLDEGLTCFVYPENTGDEGVSYDQDYDTLIGPMPGDWFTAASKYREWAHKQFWCARGPKSQWPDFTKKHLLEVPIWSRPDWAWNLEGKPDPAGNAETIAWLKNAEEWLGMPQAVLWCAWHHCRFDGNYPEYFPMQPGFAEEAKREVAAGWTVCPFINGLWYDLRTPKGAEAMASAITQNPNGQFTFPDPKTVDPLRQSLELTPICVRAATGGGRNWWPSRSGFTRKPARRWSISMSWPMRSRYPTIIAPISIRRDAGAGGFRASTKWWPRSNRPRTA